MGRPAFEPTDVQRRLVSQLAAFGAPPAAMCALVLDAHGKPIAEHTLRKHFVTELAQGEVRANSKVANALYRKAINGDTIAEIFWLKCRAHWKETAQAVEVTGANGGPLAVRSMSDAELEAIVAKRRRPRRRSG